MTGPDPIAVLVVAAGKGARAGAGLPKQFRPLAGVPVLDRSIAALRAALPTARIQIVAAPEHFDRVAPLTAALGLPAPVPGGETRQQSVRLGLEALAAAAPGIVLIHDAARPFITPALIGALLDALAGEPELEGVAPALALIDTIKKCGPDRTVAATVPRDGLWRIQTPQAFRFPAILAAHQAADAAGDISDDFAVGEQAGLRLKVVPGDEANFKLTTPEDFSRAEGMLMCDLADIRTGQGFDVHAFEPGDHVMLCGVRVPHDRALAGHSDADVALHALTDAVLGAVGGGDIGAHFPPSDAQWRGASSDRFLAHAADLVRLKGGTVAHVDVTIVCEAPKVGPHRAAMTERVAAILGIAAERVSVKATTTERLGFTGRREGIAALATATVRLPLS
mgnify:FL=1